MTQLIKSIDTVHPVACGVHADSLFRDNHLRVPDVYAETDFGRHAFIPHVCGLDA
jgi:hypothetical protein